MLALNRTLFTAVAALGLATVLSAPARAFMWVESVDAEGSPIQAGGTDIGSVSVGTNTITGSLAGNSGAPNDGQDYFTFQLPSLYQVTSAALEISVYVGSPRRYGGGASIGTVSRGSPAPVQQALISGQETFEFSEAASLTSQNLYFYIFDTDPVLPQGLDTCSPDDCLINYQFTLEAVQVPTPASALAILPLASLVNNRRKIRASRLHRP